MSICGIYNIINVVDGKIYIGSSNDIERRFRKHRSLLNRNIHENKHLQNAWNKYGEVNFKFVLVNECLIDSLLIKEQEYLDIAKKFCNNYYNFNFISSKPPSPKGRVLSEYTKRKLSILRSGKNNPQFGKSPTEITKNKMSKSHSKINYRFVNPNNIVITITNLKKFCKDNNLNEGGMYGVQKGRYKQYKGWKKYIFEKVIPIYI
jgi:group I intron endonuclease